jgi:hypothetical protein
MAVISSVAQRPVRVGAASLAGVGSLGPLEPVDEGVDAGGESFVAVVAPDVFAEGDQGGEAVMGK